MFFMKGADTVMSEIVHHSEWLEEEVREPVTVHSLLQTVILCLHNH